MPFLVEKIVYCNGEERNRETIPCEFDNMESVRMPVATIHPSAGSAEIEIELKFSPTLVVPEAEL